MSKYYDSLSFYVKFYKTLLLFLNSARSELTFIYRCDILDEIRERDGSFSPEHRQVFCRFDSGFGI